MGAIHPTAIVDQAARLGSDVSIGPYSVVGPNVTVGEQCIIHSHVVLDGVLTLGRGCEVYPFASLGTRTQDLKYDGGETSVEVGEETTIREYVTVNSATSHGGSTRVGNRCLLMAYAHVAHDCVVGDGTIIANCGTLAGHVLVEDQVVIGGLCGVHQFVRIGRMSIIGGCSKVTQDVPPFMLADGHPLRICGLNSVGLKRRNVSPAVRRALKQAFRLLYRRDLAHPEALQAIETTLDPLPEVQHLVSFVRTSERGIAG